jgi:hypothetical protein
VVDGIAERLVDVAGDGRVKADHLADGHGFSSIGSKLWIHRPDVLVALTRAA